MKNPLRKRLPREFRSDLGKYAVIFLFLIATIGLVSGFLVADHSMQLAYTESFTKYNIEDGNFTLETELDDAAREKIETEGVTIYDNAYKEETVGAATYRIFQNRTDVNQTSVLEGRLAKQKGEIAIDRLFAENNGIVIGDEITIAGQKFTVCGLVALSDYSALFRNNTDMMFDAQNFTVAVVTEAAFEALPETHLHHCYSWKNTDTTLSDKEKNDHATELMKVIAATAPLKDFIPEGNNQAIHFTGDDMGSDEAMMTCLLYIVIVIMAFVFAVTTTNTIERESRVIGTLRASGYTRGELIWHYLQTPVIVTLVGAAIGNILGYTVFKNMIANLYYGSYSLPSYHTVWSGYAFVMTTVVPCVMMLIVNLLILWRKLSLSPLRFLRCDWKRKSHKKHVVRLPNFRFLTRFRLRVILQNLHGYGILWIGIVFANIVLLFSMMMTPLLEHYRTDVLDHMLCAYQYVLKAPAETAEADAEKYAVTTLNTGFADRDFKDEITVYGIEPDSVYCALPEEKGKTGVVVSEGILEKYGLKVGEILPLQTKYDDKQYEFEIQGTVDYPATLAVFLEIDAFRDIFDKADGYFSGYFSNTPLDDIPEEQIASTITRSDLTILSDQLFDSMGNMFPLISAFAVLLYMLLVYLLSKIVIEKNAASISTVKILGYQNSEIMKLYVTATATVVVLSIATSLPLSYLAIRWMYVEIMSSFSGWLQFYIKPVIYFKMALLGIGSYAIIGALQFRKIRRIPMGEALKYAE